MTRPPSEAISRWRWLSLAVLLWAIDQAVEFQVTQTMRLHEVLPITTGFNWVNVLNPGAAFSFLADAGGWQRHFFSTIALVVSGALVVVRTARPSEAGKPHAA